MPRQDLYIGLGSLVYTIAKSDGRIQPEENRVIEHILQRELNGEIALYLFQLRESYNTDIEEAYRFAMRRFTENKKDFDAVTKKDFIRILEQVAEAYDGISTKEKQILRRCRRDIEKI